MRASREDRGKRHTGNLERMARLLNQPVYLATTTLEGRDNAWILSYATRSSLDLDDPYMVICVSHENVSHDMVAKSGIVALHLLRRDQWRLIWEFGKRSARDTDKLAGLSLGRRLTGAPILTDSVGYLENRVVQTLNEEGPGDHTCYLTRLVGCEIFDHGETEILSMNDVYEHGFK